MSANKISNEELAQALEHVQIRRVPGIDSQLKEEAFNREILSTIVRNSEVEIASHFDEHHELASLQMFNPTAEKVVRAILSGDMLEPKTKRELIPANVQLATDFDRVLSVMRKRSGWDIISIAVRNCDVDVAEHFKQHRDFSCLGVRIYRPAHNILAALLCSGVEAAQREVELRNESDIKLYMGEEIRNFGRRERGTEPQ